MQVCVSISLIYLGVILIIQYKPIWAIGGAWKISQESFMKEIEWLNMLNLRVTYGFAGNSPEPGAGRKL